MIPWWSVFGINIKRNGDRPKHGVLTFGLIFVVKLSSPLLTSPNPNSFDLRVAWFFLRHRPMTGGQKSGGLGLEAGADDQNHYSTLCHISISVYFSINNTSMNITINIT